MAQLNTASDVKPGLALAERALARWKKDSPLSVAVQASFEVGQCVAGNWISKAQARKLIDVHGIEKLEGEHSYILREALDSGATLNLNRDQARREILGTPVVPPGDLFGLPPAIVDPFDPDATGGTLGATAQWILESSRTPIPEFAMLSSIALHAGLFGRRLVGPTGAGLNLFLVQVAGTSFGKDRALKMPEVLARAVAPQELRGVLGLSNFTGDSAVEGQLRKTPCCVVPWDEFGVVLQSMTGRNAASWTASIKRCLLELYSGGSPGTTWRAKLYAESSKFKNADPICEPTLSIFGASTHEVFYAGLRDGALANGFLNRLLVISVEERPERQEVDAIPTVPPALVERLRAACAAVKAPGNLGPYTDATQPASLSAVPWGCDEARNRFREIEQCQLDACDADPTADGIIGRAAENTVRLATLQAASRDPVKPAVTLADIEWGWAIVRRSVETLKRGIDRYMADSEIEAYRKTVLAHIQNAGEEGIPRSHLMKKRGVTAQNSQNFDGAIKWLLDTAEIAGVINPNGVGRPTARYVATPS